MIAILPGGELIIGTSTDTTRSAEISEIDS
jgi:hypothetical protein